MPDITLAQKARQEKVLNTRIRLSTGETLTRREHLDRMFEQGGFVKTFTERRYDKEDDVRDKIARLASYAPIGNPNHPETKQYYAEKARLEESLNKVRTGIQLPDGLFFEVTKIELEYFTCKTIP
jgi:hypothetical protein